MGTPFIAELRLVSFNFAPKGWTLANGQVMAINQNQPLFALLGTTYGGNGQTTFQLPNMQGRVPISQGNGYTQGQAAGEYNHTLLIGELPRHPHLLMADNAAQNTTTPSMFANTTGSLGVYGQAVNMTGMQNGCVSTVGGGQPHSNQSPFTVMNWIIALQGIFPSRT